MAETQSIARKESNSWLAFNDRYVELLGADSNIAITEEHFETAWKWVVAKKIQHLSEGEEFECDRLTMNLMDQMMHDHLDLETLGDEIYAQVMEPRFGSIIYRSATFALIWPRLTAAYPELLEDPDRMLFCHQRMTWWWQSQIVDPKFFGKESKRDYLFDRADSVMVETLFRLLSQDVDKARDNHWLTPSMNRPWNEAKSDELVKSACADGSRFDFTSFTSMIE